MALSAPDKQRIKQVLSVIRENEQVANKIVCGMENKSWDLVANILDEVLDLLESTLWATLNIAKRIGSAILDVLKRLFS